MSNISEKFLTTLKEIVGAGNLLTETDACKPYGKDDSRHQGIAEAVVLPTEHQQVQQIIYACNKFNVSIFPRGSGTGTTGGAVPVSSGIVLSLEKMQRIIKFDQRNRVMIVESGVINDQVQQLAQTKNLFWPPDPGSSAACTIGGNLACNAAGPRGLKYGTTRENTLGLRAITGSGAEIKTGVYTTKGVVGYDLTRLLIGSEGSLSIITEATLKLIPMPAHIITFQAMYRDVKSATDAIIDIMSQPIIPYTLEFMDNTAISLLRKYGNLEIPTEVAAMLFLEVDFPFKCENADYTSLITAAKNTGCLTLQKADSKEAAKKLWQARKNLSPCLRKLAPKKINEDIVIPVATLPKFIFEVEKLAQRFNILIVNFGHAGNGNIHVNLLIDPTNPIENRNAELCLDEIFNLVLALDGTLSGEHGVGIEKRDYIAREIDPVTLNLMRQIKHEFDPNNILNPGKVLP